ncbi:hypothetical protein CgunFtcFv8_003232 [Champsocephalus gunnari]|uniref:RING-type E3 ubiquitin transferase n=1 Tax=Champsocephalus gunnari TaxID=52237 RepID=A0AAN8HJB5_CHAGU|nr:hypothetical protein CgunFtcFv8_003232 [Champsocephalus gunnari]
MRGSPMTSAHSHMKGPTGGRTMPGRAYWAGQGRVGPPCWVSAGPGPLMVICEDGQHRYHPLSLCNTSEDERQEGDFITIVKLEHTARRCLPLVDKARMALDKGAQAVIFDVSDDANAAFELREIDFLRGPVVLVEAENAEELMGLVNKNEEAKVTIELLVELPSWPHYDVGILLTIVLAILTIVLIFAFRYKCKSNRTWDSVHQQTMRAISRLETKTYSSQGCSGAQRHRAAWGSASSSNSSPVCAICLDDFLDGQHLRIISCAHEFHKECVDPWLLQHRTCPLCMHNIMGTERQPQRTSRQNICLYCQTLHNNQGSEEESGV